MAKGKLKCTKCKRTFGMPAHLARHMSTIHSGKTRKKVTAKRKVGRPRGTTAKRVGRPPAAGRPATRSLAGGVTDLVRGMQAYHKELLTNREQLDEQIAAITQAMEAMGTATTPSAGPRRVGRPVAGGGRTGSLKDFIMKVLRKSSKPMSPKDIAAGVRKAGYMSKAKDLTKAISNTLPVLSGVKRVGFGMYGA